MNNIKIAKIILKLAKDLIGESKIFHKAAEAIDYAKKHNLKALFLDGKNVVMSKNEADKLEQSGKEFAYLGYTQTLENGKIKQTVVTIPVNG